MEGHLIDGLLISHPAGTNANRPVRRGSFNSSKDKGRNNVSISSMAYEQLGRLSPVGDTGRLQMVQFVDVNHQI